MASATPPPGFCPEWVPALTVFDDELLYGTQRPMVLLTMGFHHSNSNPNLDYFIHSITLYVIILGLSSTHFYLHVWTHISVCMNRNVCSSYKQAYTEYKKYCLQPALGKISSRDTCPSSSCLDQPDQQVWTNKSSELLFLLQWPII